MRKRVFKIILLVLGVLFLLDIGLVVGMGVFQPEIKHADNAVVLGAAIYSPALKNRTLTALKLYQEGKVDGLVLSGGKIAERDISEAQGMQKIITRETKDLPPMILEDKSSNTYDNIKNTRDKIGADSSIVIVSDRFHVARAVLLAKRAGFTNVQWTSPSLGYYRKSEIIFYYFREIVALPSYISKLIIF